MMFNLKEMQKREREREKEEEGENAVEGVF